jgi:hypothetical protein
MLDLSSPKVTTPVALFALLSPGLLLQLPSGGIATGKTDTQSVFFHAAVFIIAYKLIAKLMGLVLTKTDLIVTAALFVALSPGLLLTLPPSKHATSPTSVLTHAIVFAIVFAFLRKTFPLYY